MDSFKFEAVAARLQNDMQDHYQCNVKVMLGHFLKRCLLKNDNDVDPQCLLQKCVDAVLPICNDRDVHYLATEYCKAAVKEQDRYPRLVKWFNTILEKLSYLQTTSAGTGTLASLGLREESSLGVMFYSCVTKEDTATHDARTPGIGVVSTDTARTRLGYEDPYMTLNEIMTKTALQAPPLGFFWDELLSVLEFKLTDKTLTGPPQTYGNTLKKHIPAVLDVTSFSPKHSILEQERDLSIFDMILELRNKKLGLSVPATVEPDNKETPPLIRNARYGAELLCRGKHATHAMAIVIDDEIAWVWWFDRQGAIQSTGIDFIHDLPYFVALLVAFRRFTLENWGIREPIFTSTKAIADDPVAVGEVDLPDVVTVSAQAVPYSDHFSLVRCGTGVMPTVTVDYDNPTFFAIKWHWPQVIWQNDANMMQKAAALDDDKYTKGRFPEHMSALDCGYSNGTIRHELGILPLEGSLARQPRVLRLLLCEELVLLNVDGSVPRLDADFETSKFMQLWMQWYQGHRILWINGIDLGDISLESLLYKGAKKGLRIPPDFDLAITEENHLVGRRNTDDPLFMALDLMMEKYYGEIIKRRYCHCLEVFIWALVLVTLFRSRTYAKMLANWNTSNYAICHDSKKEFATGDLKDLLQDNVDQRQWALTQQLVKWVARRAAILTVTYVAPLEQSDEDVLPEFEDVVAEHWSSTWPPFHRLTHTASY